MDQNQERRRGHFHHRGRRGPDRRGSDRRNVQQQGQQREAQPQDQERQNRDHVDVEQIMREIRSRIAQRQGIDLSNHQIQDLAARRLESILDPRAMKPSLLEGLRKSAGIVAAAPPEKVPNEPAYSFEDTTIYDSHRGTMRFIRKLLNPLLKLFFNPNPLIRALHLQAGLNVEAAKRDQERDRRQAEWNALHYEILQRLVTDISRTSLELQALSMRVESLAGKVDFNERRVRGIEGTMHRSRPQGRPTDISPAPTAPVDHDSASAEGVTVTNSAETGAPGEGARRRRRRRRGRRGGMVPGEMAASHGRPEEPSPAEAGESTMGEERFESTEPASEIPSPEPEAPSFQASTAPAEDAPRPSSPEPDFGSGEE